MRVVPSDGPNMGAEPPLIDGEPTNGHPRLDAVRHWLVSGVHLVDRRRRFGGHGRARGLLVVDSAARNGASERWDALAAALDRHTLRGGLSELSPEERRVITLAYLEGRTNREIATTLGVSVATARRRLWAALKRLDDYITMTGVWLSAFVLALAAYAAAHTERLGRWVATASVSPERAQRLAAIVSAGVMTTVAVGIVAFTPDSGTRSQPAPPVTAPLIVEATAASAESVVTVVSRVQTISPELIVDPLDRGLHGVKPAAPKGTHGANGCHSNPTSAAPLFPVGPRGARPHVAPVTHPGAGGCKALS
ncbi:MAG TPA: sigma-70 family RNA polymerase sigma factor [Candidatus Dormibacteraeota bacterium]